MQIASNSFSEIPVEQAIEQTVNYHSKTKGGITGFNQCPGTVQQWKVNVHQRAEITSIGWEMAEAGTSMSSCKKWKEHKEEKPLNKPFDFHPSKESTDIGMEKRKKFR